MNTQAEKIRIALVYGGTSGEHPISCATAGAVMAALDAERYEVISIAITQRGNWVPGETDPQKLRLNAASTVVPESDSRIVFAPGDGTQHVLRLDPAPLGSSDSALNVTDLGPIDVVFPLLHGPFGEDGTIQGLFEMANVPYVGCGVFASAAGMDKHFMKLVLEAAGIAVGPYVAVTRKQWNTSREDVLAKVKDLQFPLFVKPARAGSSLGITRIDTIDELDAAVAEAQIHDPKIVIEQGIDGKEVECAVLGGSGDEPSRASLPGEIVLAHDAADFYDFEHKYVDTAALTMQIPALISDADTQEVRELAVRAFDAFGGEGLARVDFFVTPEGGVLVNEINTLPGFTPFSMYPVMWEKTGLPYADLIDTLVSLALERGVGLH